MTDIATWPALAAQGPVGYRFSERTGEPVRPGLLLIAIGAAWASVAITFVAFGRWWWQVASVDGFHPSARLLTWTKPDPVSGWAVALVVIIGVISLLMVAAAGVVGFNAWAGNRWIRVGGWICWAVTGLSFLLNWWFTAAMAPLLLSVGLLATPTARRFFAAMADFRAVAPVVVPTTDIKYGPQPLIG